VFSSLGAIGSAALLLNILSPVAANAVCTGTGCGGKVNEQKPPSKNPHPQDEPRKSTSV
jgi:hypothetical protein